MVRISRSVAPCLGVAFLIAACGSDSPKTSVSTASSPGPSASSGASSGSSGGTAGTPPPTTAADASTPNGPSTLLPGSDSGLPTSTDATPPGADAAAVSTGVLPPITDPGAAGPFTPTETQNTGPSGNYTTIAPMELGQGGIKNPILVFGPGAGAWPAIYQTLLNHIASHGFVIVAYNSTPQGPELQTAMDWIVSESTRQGSIYFNKVDTTKIAAAGQSAGSLAVFNIANDPRLTTTIHINGGTFAPHTAEKNLVKVAEFICGDDPDGGYAGDEARPNCDADFQMATTPIWNGDVIGASHTTIIDNPLGGTSPTDPLKKPFLAATVAWLRWQLAGDQTMKSLFVGSNCGYCQQTSTWTVQQKNLQ